MNAYLMFLVRHALATLNEYGLHEAREALEQSLTLHTVGQYTAVMLKGDLELAWLAALVWEARCARPGRTNR